jgi:adenylate cyclase
MNQPNMTGKKRLFFPIAWKLVAMTVTLLLVATIPIAFTTSKLFKETSGRREADSNRSQANARANEVSALLSSYVDRLTVIGTLRLKELAIPQKITDNVADKTASTIILERDKDLVSFTLFTRINGALKNISEYRSSRYLESYKTDLSYLDTLNQRRPFPIEALFTGTPILKNRSMAGSAPLITIGVPVTRDDQGQISHVAFADLPLSLLQSGFSAATERIVYLVDKEGTVLAHPNEKLVTSGERLNNLPIVKTALKSKVTKGEQRYRKPKSKDYFVSAYARTLFDLVVISEAPESVILEPAMEVQRSVYRISAIVVSIAFFIIFVFSLSLTRPIEKLVTLTQAIARGNFSVQATSLVRSADEVGILATAFDGMTEGLRERDKVKNLFNKFHGSSVTENLLKGDDIKLGGSRKPVAVFFSDVRGFTAFSENRTPEQVVSMLNEYFTTMVGVIYRSRGIVDKFIGDAIMAVWGAPTSTGDDAFVAVKACLEMRQALEELNKLRISRDEEPLKIGMGLHFGEAISGTVGSEDRMEYTVIGDTVNMASRIEASTKAFGTDLLISETVADKVRERFILEEAGSAEVKGKSEPLKFFKVRGYYDSNNQPVIIKTPYSDYEAEKSEKVKIVS